MCCLGGAPGLAGWSGAGKRASWALRGRLGAQGNVHRTASRVSTGWAGSRSVTPGRRAHTPAHSGPSRILVRRVPGQQLSELRPDFPAVGGPRTPRDALALKPVRTPWGRGSPLQGQGEPTAGAGGSGGRSLGFTPWGTLKSRPPLAVVREAVGSGKGQRPTLWSCLSGQFGSGDRASACVRAPAGGGRPCVRLPSLALSLKKANGKTPSGEDEQERIHKWLGTGRPRKSSTSHV